MTPTLLFLYNGRGRGFNGTPLVGVTWTWNKRSLERVLRGGGGLSEETTSSCTAVEGREWVPDVGCNTKSYFKRILRD